LLQQPRERLSRLRPAVVALRHAGRVKWKPGLGQSAAEAFEPLATGILVQRTRYEGETLVPEARQMGHRLRRTVDIVDDDRVRLVLDLTVDQQVLHRAPAQLLDEARVAHGRDED